MKRLGTTVIFVAIVVAALFAVSYKAFNHFRRESDSSQTLSLNPTKVPTPTPKIVVIHTFNLVVKDNKLAAGPTTLSVTQGDTVKITITADADGELHLHGYDKHVDFKKNQSATISAVANISGRFTYELENTKTEIGALEVQPK
jgi:plastocyanin